LESEYESRVKGECSEVTVKLSTVEAELLSLQSENGVLTRQRRRRRYEGILSGSDWRKCCPCLFDIVK